MNTNNPYAHGVRDGDRSWHRGDNGFSAGILVFPSGARVAVLSEEMLNHLAADAGWIPGLWPEQTA